MKPDHQAGVGGYENWLPYGLISTKTQYYGIYEKDQMEAIWFIFLPLIEYRLYLLL